MRIAFAASLLGLTGCLFGGGPSAPPAPDTPETARVRADSLWDAARDHFRFGRWSKTASALDRARALMDFSDRRQPVAHFLMGEALLAQGNALQAVREFRRVADEYSSDSLAADALLRAGDAYRELWRKPDLDPTYGETALNVYRELAQRYPGTTAANRANLRIADLLEQFAVKEYRNAMFYFRNKAYDSAILSFRYVVATYPRSTVVPESLIRLVDSYRRLGYTEDVQETCAYIARFYPETQPRVADRCPTEPPAAPPG